ncbi:Protein of unknown function [Fulvimarina manganoxydans]|uniref:DUF2380 domain-containing protein n=1 Tax=Fulvimarina manganoxydans TaxID=937218 RepID=A0A1W2EFF9_9HYPH|nr:DUF3280 domain-containing protein [Fulvimarina manganoxydans]SMD08172.1 Protein of unknown function [Fulvimarina manganoxydans]
MIVTKLCQAARARQARLFPVVAALLPALLILPSLAGTPGAMAQEQKAEDAREEVAILPFELIDSSLEGDMMGENPDETKRLERLAPMLREDFETLPHFDAIDVSPVAEDVKQVNLQACGNCGITFGEKLGADIVVLGTVQKVSNLILNINAYVFDVESGEQIARGSADIRSNTDESWKRGLNYLWENVLQRQLEDRG